MKRLLLSMAFLLVSNAAFAATQAEALAKLNEATESRDEVTPKYDDTVFRKDADECLEQGILTYFQNVQNQMTQEDVAAYNSAMLSANRWWIRYWDEWDPTGPDNSITQRLNQGNINLATGWACYLAQDYNQTILECILALSRFDIVRTKLVVCNEHLYAVELYYNAALNILLKYSP